jgi:glycosyltransferase involved in cell wall biosynthesis
MDVSIIIPTFNEEKTIGSTIRSVINQDYNGKYEVIIVGGNSTDNTRKVISKFVKKGHNIRILSEKKDKSNIARARNIGVNNAKGEIIAFIDAGRVAPRDWLNKITDCLKNESVTGVGGSFELSNGLNTIEKFTGLDKIYRTNQQKKYTDVVCTGNAAFKKQAIIEINGFDEFFARRGENTDFCYRIRKKGKILCKPDIITLYKDSYNIKKFIKEHILNGFYYFFICLKYKNKTFGDDYRKFFFIIQPFLVPLFFVLALFNLYLSLWTIPIFFIANFKFLQFISKYSKKMIIPSIFLQLVRVIFWAVGVGLATLYFVIKGDNLENR